MYAVLTLTWRARQLNSIAQEEEDISDSGLQLFDKLVLQNLKKSKVSCVPYMNGDMTLDTVCNNGPVDRHRAAENQHNLLRL